MNISGGAVTIHQAMVDGRAVGYQGGVDAAGNVNASHTGFDGVVFSAAGTVSSSRFAGQLRRRGCVFTIELTKVSGTPG